MSSLNGFFSSGGSDTKSTSYLPEQAQWMRNLLSTYGAQVGAGQDSYGGTRVAPLSSTQQGLLGSLGGWSQYLTPATGGTMYGQTGTALSDILSGEMGAEPYTEDSVNSLFKSAYEAPTRKAWSEHTKPAIEEAYGGPGYWGTARMKAIAKGTQDMGDTLSGQYGSLRYAADQANKGLAEAKAGRALAAIPLAGDYIAQPQQQALAGIQGTGSLYGVASAEQQQQQAEISSNLEKWMESQQITDPQVLSVMMSLLGMNYSTSTTTQRGKGLGFDMANNALGAIGDTLGGSASGGLTSALGMIGL